MWTIMKAILILGNDIPHADNATLSVLLNAEAIAVNQDPLGVQARRVAVAVPAAASITSSPYDDIRYALSCYHGQ